MGEGGAAGVRCACNPSAVRVRLPSASSTVTWRQTVRLSSTREPFSRIPLSAFSTMDTCEGGALDRKTLGAAGTMTLGATGGAIMVFMGGHWCGSCGCGIDPCGTGSPGWGTGARAAAAWFQTDISDPGIICGAASMAEGDIAALAAEPAAATAAAADAASAAAPLCAAATAGVGAATGRTACAAALLGAAAGVGTAATGRAAVGGSTWVGPGAMSWPVLEIIIKAGAADVGAPPACAILLGADMT